MCLLELRNDFTFSGHSKRVMRPVEFSPHYWLKVPIMISLLYPFRTVRIRKG